MLQERWTPSPLLLLLPPKVPVSRDDLLTLPASGLLQNSSVATLQEAIKTLIGGGRVVEIHSGETGRTETPAAMGFGQWLLINGLQQISDDLRVMTAMLAPPPEHPLLRLMLEGRCRELRCARSFLLWLWGPLQLGFDDPVSLQSMSDLLMASMIPQQSRCRNAVQWLSGRPSGAFGYGCSERINNATGRWPSTGSTGRRRDLLLALLQQLDQVLHELPWRRHTIVCLAWTSCSRNCAVRP